MGIMDVFDPAVDGWNFENWGEVSPYCLDACEFTWDQFRAAYLGVNPTHDCVEAPLDCAFYEIFKTCAAAGNCGGMSLLALAVFKYGGYLGFCGPASFYSGTRYHGDWNSTDRADLHRAINLLQARQFSVTGIENFLDVVDGGHLNNAVQAFERVKVLLARGDHPVLSIATSAVGEAAHTVIPFKVEENPPGYPAGTRIMHIWDPNHPYAKDPAHYTGWGPGTPFHLVVRSATDWEYTSAGRLYPDGSDGWCFTVPLSAVLHKARHPMTLDMVFDAAMTAFISGPGAAVTQVSDGDGRRLYTSDAPHVSRGEFETDPELRLTGVARWPWSGGPSGAAPPGELYVMRRRLAEADLTFTVTGSRYRMTTVAGPNLLEIEVDSPVTSTDTIRVSRLGSAMRTVEFTPREAPRTLRLRQLHGGGGDWRSMTVRDVPVGREGIAVEAAGRLADLVVRAPDSAIEASVEVSQRRDGVVTHLPATRLSAGRGSALRVAPSDWQDLGRGRLDVTEVPEPR